MRRRGDQREDGTTLITMETSPENNYGTMNAVQPEDGNVFSDGSTRVDFVLVWEEPRSMQEESMGVSPAHRRWREEFLKRLRHSGLLQEQKEVLQTKKRICFVLLSAPWSVLCYYAEEISLRVPLQVVTAPIVNWSEQILSKLSLPNLMSQDVPNPPPDYYTCQFRTNKLERFLGSDNKDTFFKTTQRHQVLYEILARTPYGSVKNGEVGVDRLLNEQVFTAAYPLHEGDYQLPTPPVSPQSLSLRQILYAYWAQWSCWRRYQPLDHIREYFGEKIALYFAWLGFYTGWLLPASVVGTVIFLIGFWLVATDVPANELCGSGNSFIMCPLCNICSYWNYSSICVTYKAGLLFDNGGTVFLSVFMSLWAITFLEYWKRTCSSLSHRWDCSEFQDIEERPRPEFTAMAPMTMRNPVTGAEEPYFPENKRFNRTLTGCMVIIIMVAVVLIFLTAIILYRTILSIIIYKSEYSFFSFSAGRIASFSGSVLNLLVILLLSRIYTALAHILTRWEMHRTQTKYEDMFILKVFVFQFVNFYSSPVYIAFFKGRFIGYPGNYNTLFGVRNEDCGAGGCLIDLAQELLVIMVGKQLINNIQEFISPKVKSWWQKRKLNPQLKEAGQEAQRQEEASPWEADYQLLVCEGLFSEYLEMVIQFGFITIFVAACPLAPLFALINNWVEVRLDAQKFVTEYRRPVVERAQDIGIWFPILQFIAHMAVLSNAFLIAFTSSFVPRLYYRYTRDSTLSGFINFTLATSPLSYQQQHNTSCRYWAFRDENGEYLPEYFHLLAIRLGFVIIFEHVVFFIGRLIDLMVPDVSEEVEMKIKREHYMAKEALAENQSLGKTMIPGNGEAPPSELRQRRSRISPQESDPPSPNLEEIAEETEAIFSS
ncbi:anoctamin-7 isoform X1 [Pundamilia nyererei]|uniref:Anoctamin n=2 Tax=Haplochromini TaxID=319058 RepID=A0A9Y3VKZ8_9CICH|nr:PREDICTED: anoctamin-7 isoform X1 [Pundamilia nyererei]XP_013767405.1 PREDICTED: anoctamin-7 isoform X1 [Pundamilia nyererei]XP_039895697.1 anoctamin-7 isoform X1 [Simochromis diagramma]